MISLRTDNYGFGKVQAVNRTHLHWTWEMAAVGTPVCRPGDLAQGANRPERCFGPLPSPETVPESAHVDELWIVKDPSKVGGGNPTLGPRLYDPPTAVSWERLARGLKIFLQGVQFPGGVFFFTWTETLST